MTETFRWDRGYETGLEEIDSQHRHLVAIINAVGEHVSGRERDNVDVDELEHLFAELADYAKRHFHEEEALMVQAGVDPRHFERHTAQHRSYWSELSRLQKGRTDDDADSQESALQFLTHWLAYHILDVDQSMARQVAEIRSGVSPAEALAVADSQPTAATGLLLDALHGLLEQAAGRNRKLEALNANLDQRVNERTAELSALVNELEREMAVSRRLGVELGEANDRLGELAMTDDVTGLPNRRLAMARLERAWHEPSEMPLSVIMVDGDGFKSVNDMYGHDAGDLVLRALARELTTALRTDDMVCRMGGDEFLIICLRTPRAGAEKVAAVARDCIERLRVPLVGGEWAGSISLGVAERQAGMAGIAELLKAADTAVYAAKRAGRGCVRSHDAQREAAPAPGSIRAG